MSSWLDTVLQGVLLGGLYALFAAGLSLLFGVMRIVNIAHGDLIVLGAYLTLAIGTALGGHTLAGAVASVLAMAALGYLLYRLVLERAIGGGVLRAVLVSFGLSVILRNGLLILASPDSRRIDGGMLETAGVALGGGVRAGAFPLLTFALAVLVILALQWLTYRTAFGRALRAVAEDPQTASLTGIDSRQAFAIATALALGIAAVAGTCMGVRTNFDPAAGPDRLLFGFESVIVGGLGSLWGTLLGGIYIGVAQGIGARINPDWQQLAGHLAFLLMLALRPAGLMPQREES
jgi:branched-chain amino acid transport system permease protein